VLRTKVLKPVDHENEAERLKDLESYSIIDSFRNDYDDITAIAAVFVVLKRRMKNATAFINFSLLTV
jgi:hypothetical protein